MESQKKHPRCFSFEFFPPNTGRRGEARAAAKQLAQLKPGSSRSRTAPAARRGSGRSARCSTCARPGTRRRRTSRACSPSPTRPRDPGKIECGRHRRHPSRRRAAVATGRAPRRAAHYANELVEFIRAHFGDFFEVAVAIPNTIRRRAAQEDLQAFQRKVEAGADSAITQYFFNADATFTSSTNAKPWASTFRSSQASCRSGASPARALLRRVRRGDSALDPPEARRATATISRRSAAFGLDVVTELCDRLLRRRPGPALLHTEPGRPHHHHLAAAGL